MTSTIETRKPIDKNIGVRLRALRKERGISQTEVADFLGISFQQVQKYENGTNRLSASVLWELAQYLNVPVGSFFIGLGADPTAGAVETTEDMTLRQFGFSHEGRKIARALTKLGPVVTARFTALADGLADEIIRPN